MTGTTFYCVFCGRDLEPTEYGDCAACADSGADFKDGDFNWGRFEMESDEEFETRMKGHEDADR